MREGDGRLLDYISAWCHETEQNIGEGEQVPREDAKFSLDTCRMCAYVCRYIDI